MRVRRLLLATALGVVTACGPPDVNERLHCAVAGDGTAEITFEVTFPDLATGPPDEARAERVAALRQLYFGGFDRWARRFAEAGQASETLSWQRVDGQLRRLTRTAQLASPEALTGFFADTDLTVVLRPGRQESELSIFPGVSSRATREERRRLGELLESWSRAAVAYLHEVAGLYTYLEGRDERAALVFTAIFEDSSEGLDEFEEERLERLIEVFVEVVEVAETTDEQGVTLERLARRVYDPFPAHLSVEIDGRPIAREGFVELAGGGYEVPPLGLERALGGLEARWIEPPLLTTYERLERLGEQASFDAIEFASRPRRVAELPTADEVAAAVAEALAPAAEYRLRWRPGPAEPPSD